MKILDKFGRIAERVTDRVSDRVGGLVEDTLLPESVRLRLTRAEIAIQQERWQDAVDELDGLPQSRQDMMRVSLWRGIAYLELDRTTRAIHFLEAAVRERETVETDYFLGLAYERAGRPGDARNALLAALRLEHAPSLQFDVLSALARVYLAMHRADRAEHELRQALRVRPSDAGALTLLAAALRRQDRRAEAIEVLESHAAELSDQSSWLLLGQLAAEQGDHARAREAFDAALERGPEHLVALEGAASCALQLDELERAETLLERARWHGEPSTRALLLEAQLAWRHGDTAMAAQRFAEVLEREPGSLDALLGAGQVALVEPAPDGDPGRALRMFQRARALSPEARADILIGLGRAHLRLGDRAAAMRALDEARVLAPDSREVVAAQAELAEANGQLVEALVLWRELEALSPAPSASRFALGTSPWSGEESSGSAANQPPPQTGGDVAAGDRGGANISRLEGLLRSTLTPPRPFDASLSPAQLAAWLTVLRDHMAGSELMAPHVGALASLIERLDAPLDIAVLGEFNAGKSTLVNAWLGESVVATGVLPTTAHVNVIRYGPRRVGRLVLTPRPGHGPHAEVLELPYARLAEAIAEHDARIQRIEYLYPHPELRAVHFIDTPGFNATVDGHDDIASSVLQSADAIFWLIDVNQALSSSQLEVLEQIEAASEKVVVLLNKVDALDDEEEAELVAYLARNAGDRVRCVLPISALEAFRVRDAARRDGTEPDAEALQRARWPRFEEVLREELTDRTARLKSLEAVRRVRELATRVLDEAVGLTRRLSLMSGQMQQGREALVRARDRLLESEVSAIRERFEAQREVVVRTVSREVAEARRPSGGWLSSLELSRDDLQYLLGSLSRRLDEALAQVHRQALEAVTEPIDAAMQTLEWVASGLVASQAEVFLHRLEGFVVEERMARRLLEERVLGRLRAELQGRTMAVCRDDTWAAQLGAEGVDDAARRGMLEQLAGAPGARLSQELRAWIAEYFAAALHLCDNVRRDIERLQLDVRFKVVEPFEALLAAAGGCQGEPEHHHDDDEAPLDGADPEDTPS